MSNKIASVRMDGHIGAEIQMVKNEREGTARVEVYNMRGQLLAHQEVPGETDKETASAIGFALYNGFIFGYRSCEYRLRTGVDLLLNGSESPLM